MKALTKQNHNILLGMIHANYDVINSVGDTFNCSQYIDQPMTNYQFLTLVQTKLGINIDIVKDAQLPDLFLTIKPI